MYNGRTWQLVYCPAYYVYLAGSITERTSDDQCLRSFDETKLPIPRSRADGGLDYTYTVAIFNVVALVNVHVT